MGVGVLTVEIIPIDQIAATGRLRPASEPHVEALMASILRGAGSGLGHDGLREPVEVRPLDEPDGEGHRYALISGLHRLEACRRLERESIAAVIYQVGELEAQLLEVEENLVRADLTALDRALHVKRVREMFEAAYGEVTRGGDQRGTMPLWSEAAQERLGLSGDALKRSLRIANALQPEVVERLRGTGWDDNQKALLELCGVLHPARMAVLDRLLDPDSGFDTMREAIAGDAPKDELSPEDRWFRKSLGFFNESPVRRKLFYREAFGRNLDVLREVAKEGGFEIKPIKGWTGPDK